MFGEGGLAGDGVNTCGVVPFLGQPGVCRRCGTELTGRRTAWCSDDCEVEWQRNHYWQMARPAAVKRDGGKCVRCGGNGAQRRHMKRIFVGHTWAMKQIGLEFIGPGRDYYQELQIITYVPWLEVNHIEPRAGRGYNSGCHHHLTNLETLCHACHVVETKRQGRERRLIKEAGYTRHAI